MGVRLPTPGSYFDEVYARGDDPWHYRSRWYEARKRALLMAMLDRPRYRRAFEPGCANGEVTAALARRCDHLLAADRHPLAVRAAQQRLAEEDGGDPQRGNVLIVQMTVPHDWPEARFDLIVVSEFAYYLAPAQVGTMARRIRDSLTADGLVLACHWRHPFPEQACAAPMVHRLLERGTGFARLARHEDLDFIAHAWSPDPRSVAARENLA